MEVWVDGSSNSSGTGWAVICPSQKLILKGCLTENPTNQRAELAATIQAIFKFGHEITVYTDSTYVIGCFTSWFHRWIQNGWRNYKGKPVENQDLIKLGLTLNAHKATFVHVKAHSGILYNEMADQYAKVSTTSLMHPDWQLISS